MSEKFLYDLPNFGRASLRFFGKISRQENCAKWSDMLETRLPPTDLVAIWDVQLQNEIKTTNPKPKTLKYV